MEKFAKLFTIGEHQVLVEFQNRENGERMAKVSTLYENSLMAAGTGGFDSDQDFLKYVEDFTEEDAKFYLEVMIVIINNFEKCREILEENPIWDPETKDLSPNMPKWLLTALGRDVEEDSDDENRDNYSPVDQADVILEGEQMAVCRCFGWNQEGYQVAVWNSRRKKFEYSGQDGDDFNEYVTGFIPFKKGIPTPVKLDIS